MTTHAAWYQPSLGSWLGSQSALAGPLIFGISFALTEQEARCARFQLAYAVDDVLQSATLNGHPLDVGVSQGNASDITTWPPGTSRITAHLADGQFGTSNQLTLTVLNYGTGSNPGGLYVQGSVELECVCPRPWRSQPRPPKTCEEYARVGHRDISAIPTTTTFQRDGELGYLTHTIWTTEQSLCVPASGGIVRTRNPNPQCGGARVRSQFS